MRSILLGALAALMITSANAADDFDPANFMLPYCKLTQKELSANSENAYFSGRCRGMVNAISEMLVMLKRAQDKGGMQVDRTFCIDIPQGATNGQVLEVVLKYGETHPEDTKGTFIALAVAALRLAWPCKK
jgi:hypothetical protein